MFLLIVAVVFPYNCVGIIVNDPQRFIAEVFQSTPANLNAYSRVIDIRTTIECAKECLIDNQGLVNFYKLTKLGNTTRQCTCKVDFAGVTMGSDDVDVDPIMPPEGNTLNLIYNKD